MKIYSKVQNMTLAGAIVAVVAYLLSTFAGIVLSPELVSALIVIVAAIVGYFTPEKVGSHG